MGLPLVFDIIIGLIFLYLIFGLLVLGLQAGVRKVVQQNTRKFSLILSIVIAIAANVDTFYMVNQLSDDSSLRNSLVQQAETVQESGVQPESREDIENTLGVDIEEVDLPISWSPDNMDQQLIYRMNIKKSQAQKELRPDPDTGRLTYRNPENHPFIKRCWGWLQQITGWVASGIFINIAAQFWNIYVFDRMIAKSQPRS